jgi:GWxTD domain-containing protein
VNTPTDSLALYHYKKGENHIVHGDTTGAIKAFELAVWHDRDFSKAHHRMAELYLGLGTLEDRLQAKWALERAVRLEPENVYYLITQLQYLLRIGAYDSARRVAKKIIRIDPQNAEAYFTLGYIHEIDWLHFVDMISPQSTSSGEYMGTFYLADVAEEDIEKAKEYYRKAAEVDPMFSDATYRLALLCYEQGQLGRMVELLKEVLGKDPHNDDYRLFLGLAYHRMRMFDAAWTEYRQAMEIMEPEKLAVFQAIDLILTPDVARSYRMANVEYKNRLQKRIWKELDPLYLTEVNERKLEHYGRVAYANLRFSRIRYGVEGWKTDQGSVFIRYGAPYSHFKTRPSVGGASSVTPVQGSASPKTSSAKYGSSSGFTGSLLARISSSGTHPDLMALNFSRETWNYPGFAFVFVDRNWSGDYRHSNTDYFRSMVKFMPDWYEYTTPANRFPVVASYARFKGEKGKTVLEVYQDLPKERIWYLEDQGRYALKRGVFLFDKEYNEVNRVVQERPFLFTYEESVLLMGWNRLDMKPGIYHLVVEFLEPESGMMGRWMEDVDVWAYDDYHLALSDLILAREIGDYKERGELRRGGLRIMPGTLALYDLKSIIPLFFEVYNLTFLPDGTTHYRVTFTVESIEKKKGVGRLISRLSGDKSSGKVITSYDYRGDSGREVVYQALQLEKPLPKDYRLTVEVTDLNTNQKAAKEKVFGLREAEEE